MIVLTTIVFTEIAFAATAHMKPAADYINIEVREGTAHTENHLTAVNSACDVASFINCDLKLNAFVTDDQLKSICNELMSATTQHHKAVLTIVKLYTISPAVLSQIVK